MKVLCSFNANYEIHDAGFIYSIRAGKFLKGLPNRKGYLKVFIGGKSYTIHRLVAIAFVPNPLNKPEVNHLDGDKTNNASSNLAWATSKENKEHAMKNGLFGVALGEKNGNAKLKNKDVETIKQLLLVGILSGAAIGRQYGVSKSTINSIKKGRFRCA